MIRVSKGTCLTAADGRRRKLGQDEVVRPGALRWLPQVRYALYHGRPRDLWTTVALCWRQPRYRTRLPRHRPPKEPWYLATSLPAANLATAWYRQRGWIEQRFKDSKSRFGPAKVQVRCAACCWP